MKSIFAFCLLFLSIMVYASAYPKWGGSSCSTDDDCGEAECCLKQFGGGFGHCLKRPQEGEMCIPQKFDQMFQQVSCPCADGLVCMKGGKDKSAGMKYSSPPRCQPAPESSEEK
uniref:Prokineticin domain-containing protein n=1 Tax=Parasteatoda tepidariorum TaxID=114398 RepID=A0A2L2YCG7_PARTP